MKKIYVFIAGQLFDLSSTPLQAIEQQSQSNLDSILSGPGKALISVSQPTSSSVSVTIQRNRSNYQDVPKDHGNLFDIDLLFGNGLNNQEYIFWGNFPYGYATIMDFRFDAPHIIQCYNMAMKEIKGTKLKGLEINTTPNDITAILQF